MDDLNVMMNLTKIQIFAQIVSFSFTIYVYANDLKTFRNKLCITCFIKMGGPGWLNELGSWIT